MRPVGAILAGGLLLAGLFGSSSAATPRMRVAVHLEDLATQELHVTLELRDLPVRRLRGVPTYVDNPVAAARGEVVRSVRARSRGEEVRLRWRRTDAGETVFDLDREVTELDVSYTLRVDFVASEMVERYPIRVPAMDAERAWLSGNHVFLTPESGTDRPAELRRPVEIAVDFDLPPGIELYGPPPDFRLRNLHELLSVQFGLGRFTALAVRGPGWSGSVILARPAEFTRAEQARLAADLRTMIARSVGLFGEVPFEQLGLFVFRGAGTGGLEGAWAAQAYLPASVDLADPEDAGARVFRRVTFHEVVHTWVPIALAARDDPWFKEGVSSYYGNVLAARAGWMDPPEVLELFARYDPESLEPVPLSDPRIWYEEYSGESWRRLSYDRGHAVALLLDLELREATPGRRSLDDVLRRLYREHRRDAFDREQFLGAIRTATGVEPRAFFARWVDTTRAPELAEVERALRRLLELGVYDPEPSP